MMQQMTSLALAGVLTVSGAGAMTHKTETKPAAAATTQTTAASWLPAGTEQKKSETKANPALAKAIIDYYKIPKENQEKTKYYYNYVDLNGDGTQEILAVVMGPDTSGTGGDSMVWVLPNANMTVAQSFTLVRMPVLVTKDATNGQKYGARGLIVERSGGGAPSELVELTSTDGEYTNVSSAKVLKNTDGITGTAILCNDVLADSESGNYLTLAQK